MSLLRCDQSKAPHMVETTPNQGNCDRRVTRTHASVLMGWYSVCLASDAPYDAPYSSSLSSSRLNPHRQQRDPSHW